MQHTPSDYTKTGAATPTPNTQHPTPNQKLTYAALADLSESWILDGEIAQRSPRTIGERRALREKLLWFLRHHEYRSVGRTELRAFLAYVATAHTTTAGRWGTSTQPSTHPTAHQPASPATLASYHRLLCGLFNWIAAEEQCPSPMARIEAPRVPVQQVQPFTPEQLRELLAATNTSHHPKRDLALLWFMLDTGARAGEVCALLAADVDFSGRRCFVIGKGRKRRVLPMGRTATKALWAYQRDKPDQSPDRFFHADQGPLCNQGLTESGLFQIVQRLGQRSGIQGVRCSPHTFRHTCAVEFLRAGGSVFALQELLGHTSLIMVRRYVALAQADVEAQHRQFSPADRLKAKK